MAILPPTAPLAGHWPSLAFQSCSMPWFCIGHKTPSLRESLSWGQYAMRDSHARSNIPTPGSSPRSAIGRQLDGRGRRVIPRQSAVWIDRRSAAVYPSQRSIGRRNAWLLACYSARRRQQPSSQSNRRFVRVRTGNIGACHRRERTPVINPQPICNCDSAHRPGILSKRRIGRDPVTLRCLW